ncbi:MAG: hypothetical protein HY243_09385 [Proteobacteria bacterium]|nr:hypothetical protein [Pseudomonadota bacterium]
MTLGASENPPELGGVIPEHPQKRDLLGIFCFYFHFVVMLYIVLGWLVPLQAALGFYLVFLPGVFAQWQFNKNSCVLNNIESWLRTRQWRDPNNREEGAWLQTLINDLTGWGITARQMDLFTNGVLVLLWGLGLYHLFWW